ncbi:unnamed protein product [Brassica napus]|uniref:(rape) hypothetical protein n=1 Tax=Brassica napus TaxID=3708 RepID=A0A816XGW9_BRANA|nr:unnamed protein product [Brassica napus]
MDTNVMFRKMEGSRDPSHSGMKWSTNAKVESLAWVLIVSLEDGTVKGFDIRASDLSPSFTIHAHDKEVSSISYNTNAPNGRVFSVSFSADYPFLLAIGAKKGKIHVWDTLSDTAVSRRYGSNRP